MESDEYNGERVVMVMSSSRVIVVIVIEKIAISPLKNDNLKKLKLGRLHRNVRPKRVFLA